LTRTTIFPEVALTQSPKAKGTFHYVAQYQGDATYAATDSPKKALAVQ
jgi:hypothetical protein